MDKVNIGKTPDKAGTYVSAAKPPASQKKMPSKGGTGVTKNTIKMKLVDMMQKMKNGPKGMAPLISRSKPLT